jgi:hypothetical protein
MFLMADTNHTELVYTYDRAEKIEYIVNQWMALDEVALERTIMACELTILDVEQVDKLYIVFDAIMVRGRVCVNQCYLDRHLACVAYVQQRPDSGGVPCPMALAWSNIGVEPITTRAHCPVSAKVGSDHTLVVKPVYPTASVGPMWCAYRDGGSISMEGIVFTRLLNRYEPYRCDMGSVVKWKAPENISVDCRICPISGELAKGLLTVPAMYTSQTHGNVRLGCMAANKLVHVASALLDREQLRYVGSVGEFTFRAGKWVFVQHRQDKVVPNSMETFIVTVASMVEKIGPDSLVEHLGALVK